MGTQGRPISKQEAQRWAADIAAFVGAPACVTQAGSIRRGREVVNDIDLVVVSETNTFEDIAERVRQHFSLTPRTAGPSQSINFSRCGVQIDLYSATAANQGAMLLHLTGSRLFNIGMRGFVKKRGGCLSQLELRFGDEPVAANSEASIFHALGCTFIPPAERDDWWAARRRHKIRNNLETSK